MKEILKNIIQVSNERVKNPFIGSVILSWLFFNWRVWVTLFFSNEKIEYRIEYINENFLNENNGLYYPLVFALAYTLILPYIMWLIDSFIKRAKDSSKESLNKEKLKDIINRQKIAIEESKYENIKANYVEIADLNKKLENMAEDLKSSEHIREAQQEINQELKKENEKINQYMNLQDPDIREIESNPEKEKWDKEFLDFATTEAFTYLDEIGSEISQFKSLPSSANKFVVEKLIFAEIIRKVKDFESDKTHYNFTPKGRYFWKNFIMSKPIITKQERDKLDELPF